jgi:hypothetical protein
MGIRWEFEAPTCTDLLDLAKLLIKLGAQISHLHPTRSYPNLLESIFVNRFLYYHDQRIKGYII